MNWVCNKSKQFKKSTRTRQKMFFALRRQNTNRSNHSDHCFYSNNECDNEGVYSSTISAQRTKRVHGSFDIFALVGKEESANTKSVVALDSWPKPNCSFSTRGKSNCTSEILQEKGGISEISPVLATGGETMSEFYSNTLHSKCLNTLSNLSSDNTEHPNVNEFSEILTTPQQCCGQSPVQQLGKGKEIDHDDPLVDEAEAYVE
ncbi:hypothetical protein BX070DRAFT_248396 [Coemansia spiralis]|nr:hypothetical protein BX070DRAFT_248396 [Coemansia spiralis]